MPEGTVVKNRVHLDARGGTGLLGEERLLADDENESCQVRQDIEGHSTRGRIRQVDGLLTK